MWGWRVTNYVPNDGKVVRKTADCGFEMKDV